MQRKFYFNDNEKVNIWNLMDMEKLACNTLLINSLYFTTKYIIIFNQEHQIIYDRKQKILKIIDQ